MPTSKLWLEHTERAAWDSVEALRERLLQAEQRLQSLLPNASSLPRLLELLDKARQEHALSGNGYDELFEGLLQRLVTAEAAAAAARTPAPILVDFAYREPAPSPARAAEPSEHDADDLVDDDSDLDPTEFVRSLQRRHAVTARELPRDVNRLLMLLEAKVDDLAELEGAALREAAVDLAIIASRLDAANRSKG